MRRTAIALLIPLHVALADTAGAQTLRSRIEDLFRFGDCGQPLCLLVNAGAHGDHFIPGTTASSDALLDFFTDAIGSSVANIPISSSSGGVTFSFEGGAPVQTSVSSGPIFAERAQTLGRGRLLMGANVTSLQFRTFRSLPLNDILFNFTHSNVVSPVLGDPSFENDIIQVRVDLGIDVLVTTAFLTYGLLDRIDVGVAVPLVRTSLDGTSRGEVFPFGNTTDHRFGTPSAPSLTATAAADGSSLGLGDVAARVKINLSQSDAAGLALFGDVRLATGDEEELLGAGSTSARVLGVYSGRYGSFSPHLNAGALIRTGELQTNAVVAALGFDNLVGQSFTLAADVLAEVQLGENKVNLPTPTVITQPFVREITPTNLPGTKDHVVSLSLGGKYRTTGGVSGVLNMLVPIRAGSLQPRVAWTAGLEYSF